MSDSSQLHISEAVSALEQQVDEQKGQIDALTTMLADLLAAHAVLNDDVRLFSFIGADFHHSRQIYEQGGTQRIAASFFGARCDLLGRILGDAASSRVLENYWFRSFFRRREERQLARLKRIRDAILSNLNE